MSEISFDEFKSQVITDFKMASLSREVFDVAQREDLANHLTHSSDVAQVALAKFVEEGDVYISSKVDLGFLLAKERTTPFDFFATLFDSSQNISGTSDASFLSVAAGSAIAQKRTENKHITLCTIGGAMAIDGNFLETVYSAVNERLPLCIVLWNNNGDQSSGNLIKLMSGFAKLGHDALSVQAVRGDNYVALCRTFATQIDFARQQGAPSLTFVDGIDGLSAMSEWVAEHEILTQAKLDDITKACRQAVERDRKEAYLRSLVNREAPILRHVPSTEEVFKTLEISGQTVTFVGNTPNAVSKAIGMARNGLTVFVDGRASEIANSSLNRCCDMPIVIRTTDEECGGMLLSVDSQRVFYAASRPQAKALCEKLLQERRMGVVVDTVDDNQDFGIEPISKVQHQGSALTIVCYGSGVVPTLDAAQILASKHIDVEVVSLLSFSDIKTVLDSLTKTKRLLFVANDFSASSAKIFFSLLAENPAVFGALTAKPQIVRPQSLSRPIEAGDICEAVVKYLK